MPERTPGFIAYIDEAGDPGVRARRNDAGASSEWFVLSGVVVSAARDGDVVDWVRDMREAVRAQQQSPLHYRSLSDPNRQRVCRMLSTKPVRIFSVASHKANMRRHHNRRMTGNMGRGEFYNWCLRLLFERMSEWCARRSRSEYGEERPIRTVFSERGGHDYEHLKNYLRKLDLQALNGGTVLKAKQILPGMVPVQHCHVRPHDSSAGLQLADIAASALFQAAETESSRHSLAGATHLRDRSAREARGKSPAGFGLMLLPLPHQGAIPEASRPIFEHYGYKFR